MSHIVQERLCEIGLANFVEETKVIIRRHSKYPHLVLFKYDMVNGDIQNPIVQKCRGLILDESKDWNVVSYPFDKFFNYGEPGAASPDWSTVVVQEKLDGSLMTMYPYMGQWHVATSGMPDAIGPPGNLAVPFVVDGEVRVRPESFAQYFWETYRELNGPQKPDINYCYMFELTGPLNRVVVDYKKPNLTLIGARHLTTYQEVLASDAINLLDAGRTSLLNPVRVFPLNTQQEVEVALTQFGWD